MPDEPVPSGITGSQVRAWAIALSMVYGTVGFALIGLGIDWVSGTLPWFTLGMAMLGVVVGMYRFIREAQALNRSSSARGGGRGLPGTGAGTSVRESGPPDEKKGP